MSESQCYPYIIIKKKTIIKDIPLTILIKQLSSMYMHNTFNLIPEKEIG
jgi:hypothetical protein